MSTEHFFYIYCSLSLPFSSFHVSAFLAFMALIILFVATYHWFCYALPQFLPFLDIIFYYIVVMLFKVPCNEYKKLRTFQCFEYFCYNLQLCSVIIINVVPQIMFFLFLTAKMILFSKKKKLYNRNLIIPYIHYDFQLL